VSAPCDENKKFQFTLNTDSFLTSRSLSFPSGRLCSIEQFNYFPHSTQKIVRICSALWQVHKIKKRLAPCLKEKRRPLRDALFRHFICRFNFNEHWKYGIYLEFLTQSYMILFLRRTKLQYCIWMGVKFVNLK